MRVWRGLLRSPLGLLGVTASAAAVMAACVSLVWTPHDPLAIDPGRRWAGWSSRHWLGTDALGRDVASRLLAGAQITVANAFLSVGLAVLLGMLGCALIVFLPRGLSVAAERSTDLAVSFPTLLIAVVIATVTEGSWWGVVLAIGLGTASTVTRTILPEVRRSMASDHVLWAKAAGAGPWWLLTRHVMPDVRSTLIVRATQLVGVATLAEAGLSYLGLGAPPPAPSWGRMLAEQQGQIHTRPEVLAVPALVIVVTTVGFNLLGDSLRDVMDVREGS